jgi:predicted aspartyl protease
VSEADAVSLYYLDLTAINPKREELRTDPVRVLLDTGAENSWLPAKVLAGIGICPRRKKAFRSADGRTIVRDVGYCFLAAEGFETADEVVFAEPGDMCLLGVRTLEGFGVTVDPVAHRLVERPLIVAVNVAGGVGASGRLWNDMEVKVACRRPAVA